MASSFGPAGLRQRDCVASPNLARYERGKQSPRSINGNISHFFQAINTYLLRICEFRLPCKGAGLFNLAIGSKIRGCDPVKLRAQDVCRGERVASRATVVRQGIRRAVRSGISAAARENGLDWIAAAGLKAGSFRLRGRAIHGAMADGARPAQMVRPDRIGYRGNVE